MSNFYTNVAVRGSKIQYRGVENGRRVRKEVPYNPTLFIRSNKPTKHTTVHGQYLEKVEPGSMWECRKYVEEKEKIDNFKVYGNQRYEYTFISDCFDDEVAWDKNLIKIANIDIEVGSENGFPDPITASEPITAITLKTAKEFIVFGCGEFVNQRSDVQYIRCSNEIDLIKHFIDVWTGDYPDIITGWNTDFFDMPYLINRIKNKLDDTWAQRLSPWGRYRERTAFVMGRTQTTYVIAGICVLDYMQLYKKFAPHGKSQETYRLDHICSVEIGERKVAFEGSLHTLYRDDYQKFIEYNIRDVELVEKLDNKLKLIDLALTMAFNAKVNFDDVFTPVKVWSVLTYNHLRKKNMVMPPLASHTKNEYTGGYCKDPILGMHDWVVSFDVTSLYPSLIVQNRISPENLVDQGMISDRINQLKKSI